MEHLRQQRSAAKTIWRRIFITLAILLATAIVAGAVIIWQQNEEAHRLPFALDANPVIGNMVHSIDSTTRPSSRRLQDFELDGNEVVISPAVSAEVRQILAAPLTYSFSVSQCFEPGMSLSFGSGSDRVDVVICLLCNRVVFYRGDQQVARHLSDEGNRRFAQIYKKLFGSESPPI